MIHPYTELRFVSPEIGHGVFATQFIPKGTIVYVDDPLEIHIPPDSPLLNHPVFRRIVDIYAIIKADGSYEISWDLAKYVNHCCHYNTITTGWGFDIAVRDIHSGEHITDDYGMFNVDYQMTLNCSFEDCRGRVRASDYERCEGQWEADAREALAFVDKVPQLLWEVMDEETRKSLEFYLQTGDGYRPVKAQQFEADEIAMQPTY